MSAAKYTPEEEARWKLPPLPDVLFIGAGESARLNREYNAARDRYRAVHPGRDVKGDDA